jgi:hypothetical protein
VRAWKRDLAGGKVRATECAAKKKEEFTGLMFYMAPGNSFPQICVVSGMIMGNVPKRHKSTKVLDFW